MGSPANLAPRPLSSLTYRILAINIAALAVLIIGITYLGQYRKTLTTAELELLRTEAQLYAALAGETMQAQTNLTQQHAERYARVLSETDKNRQIIVFGQSGKFLAMAGLSAESLAKADSEPEFLPDPSAHSILDQLFNFLVKLVTVEFNLPPYPAYDKNNMKFFPDVADALQHGVGLSVWKAPDGGLLLSAASPIYRQGSMMGVLLITKTDTSIEHTFIKLRLDIFRIFVASLTITFALSLYLSGIIGHPLRQLAQATEAIRKRKSRDIQIPDFSHRHDEIGELSISIREMTQALYNRMDSIEAFAADVAHELKNPLTSLHSAVETLQRVKKEEDRERLQNVILHDVRRMDRLISDISAASRLDAALSRESVQAVCALKDVLLPLIDSLSIPMQRGAQAQHNPSIILNLPISPLFIKAHASRLSQVFQNIIGNALSFSPEGKPITITAFSNGPSVIIHVDDCGPGIPENRLETIFDRFYSERPDSESFGNHSGLGLSITRQIVKNYGGTIHAENKRDTHGNITGARFILIFQQADNEK